MGFKLIRFDRTAYNTAKSELATAETDFSSKETAKIQAETALAVAQTAAIELEKDSIYDAEKQRVQQELTSIINQKEQSEIKLIVEALEAPRTQ